MAGDTEKKNDEELPVKNLLTALVLVLFAGPGLAGDSQEGGSSRKNSMGHDRIDAKVTVTRDTEDDEKNTYEIEANLITAGPDRKLNGRYPGPDGALINAEDDNGKVVLANRTYDGKDLAKTLCVYLNENWYSVTISWRVEVATGSGGEGITSVSVSGVRIEYVTKSNASLTSKRRKQDIARFVRSLVSPGDPQAALDRRVDKFRRTVRSAAKSGAQLTQVGGRYYVLEPLLEGGANFSILMDDGLLSPRDSWTMLTRVVTMLNADFVAEADKVTISRKFLAAMGASSNAPLDRYELPELYGELLYVEAAIYEARQLGLLVGKSFTEAQARETARAIRGWREGQHELLLLHSYLRRRGEQNDAENAEIEAAARRIVDKKRQALRRILTPEQFDDLYIKKSYDSLGFWQARQKSQR